MGYEPNRLLGPQRIITKFKTNLNWIDEIGRV